MPTVRAPTTVVFTDLDGTLLDYDGYTWAPAAGALRALSGHGVAIVFCSSKTLAEQRVHQHEMGVEGPMIVENGSAVVVPRGWFPGWPPADGAEGWHRHDDYDEMVLGVPHARVVAAVRDVRRTTGLDVRGYSDMTLEEVKERTGLSEDAARRARAREFSETVVVRGGPGAWRVLLESLRERGLRGFGSGPTGTIVGLRADKGAAVLLLAGAYRTEAARLDPDTLPPTTVGIGDAANDVPMLRAVDRAFLVERPGGGWADADVADLERVDGVGPVGWARAVRRVLGDEERP